MKMYNLNERDETRIDKSDFMTISFFHITKHRKQKVKKRKRTAGVLRLKRTM